MTHTKLLMRRLAYVPWLLVVGLVLGWSGEAVATSGDDHSYGVDRHVHATDPKMVLTFEKAAPSGSTPYANKIKVSWSKSRKKEFEGSDATKNGAELVDPTYKLTLFSGEIPAYSAIPAYSSNVIFAETEDVASDTDPAFTHTFTGTSDGTEMSIGAGSILYNDQSYDTGGTTPKSADGKYWVRLKVEISGEPGSYFAKQIVLEPDYKLSVSPTSIREDDADRPTNITVTVSVGDNKAVDKDTSVLLDLAPYAKEFLDDRFRITLPSLKILKDKTEAKGNITFTPVDNEDAFEGDLPITIEGFVGSGKSVASADITLIDDDKKSEYINLSFSPAELNKRDPATNIIVTATLDGKTLAIGEHLSFGLTIDRDYETDNPGTAAERDNHYTARMATITIRGGSVSGRATINISPRNVKEITSSRYLRVKASTHPQTDASDEIKVNGALIKITGDPSRKVTGLTAAPFSIREDAGSKEVTLEITLQNPVVADETVRFNFEDSVPTSGSFAAAIPAERDNHYHVRAQPFVIPRGQTKGTTTMTVTVSNDKEVNKPRAFTVIATVGNHGEFETGILITDDDSTSESITLEANPVEISESAGLTQVKVTGILHGKAFANEIVVPLIIDIDPKDRDSDGKIVDVVEAVRDLDYTASLTQLRIPANSTEGTTTITITPTQDDDAKEGDEKIRLKGLGKPEAKDEYGDVVELTVNHVDITLKDSDAPDDTPQPGPQDPTKPAFAADAAIADQSYTAGVAIDPLVLPEAIGGDAPLTYSIFSLSLPAGLAFDPATRTLSGTPTAATDAPVTVIYTVIDKDRDAATPLAFSITVEEGEVPPPVAGAELMATPSAIREDAGTTPVSLTVKLMAAKDTAERITFTIVDPSEGKAAVRDVDYDATLGAVVSIPAGATAGTTTLTLTPVNNTKTDGLRALGVQATFSSGATLVQNIEINDDENAEYVCRVVGESEHDKRAKCSDLGHGDRHVGRAGVGRGRKRDLVH